MTITKEKLDEMNRKRLILKRIAEWKLIMAECKDEDSIEICEGTIKNLESLLTE